MRKFHVLAIAAIAAVLIVPACVPPPTPPPAPTPCPIGYFSATGETPCTPAPAGSYVDTTGATESTPCAIGTYQSLTGQDSCLLAPPGTFVVSSGAIAPTDCPLGKYQPNSGSISCISAQIGTYVDTPGSAASTPCPSGSTTLGVASTSPSDCIEMLAVAFTNRDAVEGFDPTSSDVLIAALLDTNTDDAVSVGDLVVTHRYPTDLDATGFDFFTVTNHAVDSVASATAPLIQVGSGASTFFFGIGSTTCGPFEQYGEVGTGSTVITDYTWCVEINPSDQLGVNTSSPSAPNSSVSASDTASLHDDFLDMVISVTPA